MSAFWRRHTREHPALSQKLPDKRRLKPSMDLVDQRDYLPDLTHLESERWFRRTIYQAILDENLERHPKMRNADAQDVDPLRVLTIGCLGSDFDYDQLNSLVELLCSKHSLPVPTFIDMTCDEKCGILVYHNILRRKFRDINTAAIAIQHLPFDPPISMEMQRGWYPINSLLGLKWPFEPLEQNISSGSDSNLESPHGNDNSSISSGSYHVSSRYASDSNLESPHDNETSSIPSSSYHVSSQAGSDSDDVSSHDNTSSTSSGIGSDHVTSSTSSGFGSYHLSSRDSEDSSGFWA